MLFFSHLQQLPVLASGCPTWAPPDSFSTSALQRWSSSSSSALSLWLLSYRSILQLLQLHLQTVTLRAQVVSVSSVHLRLTHMYALFPPGRLLSSLPLSEPAVLSPRPVWAGPSGRISHPCPRSSLSVSQTSRRMKCSSGWRRPPGDSSPSEPWSCSSLSLPRQSRCPSLWPLWCRCCPPPLVTGTHWSCQVRPKIIGKQWNKMGETSQLGRCTLWRKHVQCASLKLK